MRLVGKNDAINGWHCELGRKALFSQKRDSKKLRIATHNQDIIGPVDFRLKFFSAKFQVK
ncbi:hypothetical protein JEM67_16710 [Serratia sp. PAMC26656]|uniref:hypothetical protein n=1 Tax=Serratia sp. PAMC26656 TaxID=2775909 RepID=UPI0018F2FAF8|nr:hypothetical protein [Serratia sp. PAMC26656]MBJ7889301.1 hypothetical protein [Serratia sp. PAMC26656]